MFAEREKIEGSLPGVDKIDLKRQLCFTKKIQNYVDDIKKKSLFLPFK